ncbi:hypothetical protein DPMN_137605 [Dreissena polymorpha]|uniref:Uncharacterized protein n=1 Tax=Dreissena polymorpha TaxID=45954 RepID=A0A9D4G244_DREPO|nr:hypothetical protein DPMN_137605 [Dreissena polymorpha]
MTILNNPLNANIEEKKNTLYQQYVAISSVLVEDNKWNIKIQKPFSVQKTVCDVCQNNDPRQFEMDESNKKFCLICLTQHDVLETSQAVHKDYDRVKIVTKVAYSRIVHFHECIKQYQDKQNCKIPQEVFDNLHQKFRTFRLLNDSDNAHIKYSRITKNTIIMFLKQLNYANHYENANYIFYVLVGKRIDDIAYLEDKIIEDFKELSSLYDSIYGKDKPMELKRKNFINVQYILFQRLRNRHHMCTLEDFVVLKTIEKKKFYDKICSHSFKILGWNFKPTF